MSGSVAGPAVSDGRDDEAGFLMLGLAQMVTFFALWMALWPTAFGFPDGSDLALALGGVFTAGGVVGFYLAFQALSFEG